MTTMTPYPVPRIHPLIRTSTSDSLLFENQSPGR